MKKIFDQVRSYVSLTVSIIALVSMMVGYFTGVKVTQHDVEELKREMIESYKLHYKQAEINGGIIEFMRE